ncbi:LysR family transcriptional regulator [Parvularcula oceani]|uniref:LysR family transcriptional regulator n=1 Tax=Parvularcula oceani TaxID=1247963 RepID=UPI0004E1478D|nr:LysR family transcriptional regulator [Parvularcula oceani]
MDSFEDMQTFRLLAREGTITAAAEAMGVAPSAVSRRLKALEARLGAQLVRRDSRRLLLTAAGRTYLRGAERLLRDLDALEDGLRAEGGRIAGTVRMTAPLSFGLYALPDVLSGFLEAHPEVDVDLNLSDDAVDLVGEGYDLALRIGALSSSSLIAKRLCSVPFALCASPEFIEREGPFRTPHDLAGLPGLVYSNVARGELVSWTGPGEPGQAALRPRVATNNGDLAAELAARGHGLVCEPRFVLAPAIEAGRLVELFADHEWPSLDLHVLYPPGGPMPARLRALIDHLAAALRP